MQFFRERVTWLAIEGNWVPGSFGEINSSFGNSPWRGFLPLMTYNLILN